MPEDRIHSANQYLGTRTAAEAVDWQAFSAGSSNQLYRSQGLQQALVLRLNAPAAVAFGVCRQREAALLSLLAGQRWFPQVLRNAPEAGWLMMNDHGVPAELPLSDLLRQQLLAAVAGWQRLAPESGLELLKIDYQKLFGAFLPAFQLLDNRDELDALVTFALALLEQLPAVAYTITHHDLHPGNLCFNGTDLVVIDWEYGALGSPWFDAAALSLHCGLDGDEIARLPAFCTLGRGLFEQGLGQARLLLEVLEVLWYWARDEGDVAICPDTLNVRTQLLLKQAGDHSGSDGC